ncbi:MAG: SGNH/GDSL hydrolase family protein, partial [Planctomycetota bacterium]|nr:SGNH/GDSL hydrolase family protein [Planctomycetota bacterium]
MSRAKVVLCAIAILAMSAAAFAAPAPEADTGKAKAKAKAKAPDPALAQVEDVPGLPRVLLIGDSISMGYTPGVRELLKGKANVRHPPENCAATVVGLKRLDVWLGEKKWDVIHFNFGLHDMKYIVDEKGTMGSVEKGKQWVPLAEY